MTTCPLNFEQYYLALKEKNLNFTIHDDRKNLVASQ